MNESQAESVEQRSKLRFAPLILFVLLAVLFLSRLFYGDASRIPSALIGKPVPNFNLAALPDLKGIPGINTDDLRQGHVSIINIFASWCAPCRQEHPILMALSRDPELRANEVEIYGLSYKDEPENAKSFLQDDGNPFQRIGVDPVGRIAIDFGVYGVPETFIITGEGKISFKFIGPLTSSAMTTVLIPEIRKALKSNIKGP